jgi:multidrug efflux system membrane fusion protein
MKNSKFLRTLLGICLAFATATVGCRQAAPQVAPPEVPVVPVSLPVQREVTDFVDFTGRTAAINSVDIRARVTGYLIKMPFQEGAEVKTGDLLFEIDPRPYQAQVDQATAQVNLYKAQLKLTEATFARDQAAAAQVAGAVTPEQLDQDRAAIDQADAQVKAAQASLEAYRLNLSFTKVTSPIDGQVSRYYQTLGNLVLQDQTILTTVVSLDPIYVYFDIDEPTVLRVRTAINEGRIKPHAPGQIPVLLGLQGEDGFPREGTINFINNQFNPATGSILVRGIFSNPLPPHGRRLMAPGMFVRIRLPIGQPYPALLVIDRAIGSDQGLKYVYVVDSENKVQYRRVTTGALQNDGLRVISEGLVPNDRVAVGALQQIRPRMTVKVEQMPMPSLSQPAAATTPPPNTSPGPLPPPTGKALGGGAGQ